ncbi:MAG: CD225/dispanin family protein [Lysobacter sp.]|nr:MAG: CD225/dispanin family protein [Lysobacter sp.]
MSMPPPIQPPPPPPPQMSSTAPADAIPTHMAWSIVVTVATFCICCVVGAVPGIVAIVFASKVNREIADGRLLEARRASRNAKIWCWVATGVGVLGIVYWAVSIFMAFAGNTPESLKLLEQIKAAQQR